ncbi:hypothetical protein A2856_00785 [Candidatus Uhrbacteria bacterium RIFCSPHIGHO2_01_FULL_63_20]|uniref:TrbC/VIRB2 family protein n=1 Tax=Candidatus Uhrbacteria bacterium RIFCSPHIGHO2_01_FULL_63_20 TaxID=1802385 RepID=A0A1F7TM11_9BACT|nr:MAG: hypothetical protein A2856_00785 [Candidatus Uhrbacteria bacterium RIFCSPHIGHO2_01_FULL_63_20]
MRRFLPFLVLFLIPLAASAQRTLQNPLGSADLRIVIGNVIRVVIGFSGVLALASFIWGGILFLTAAGNEERVKKGKNTLIWASIGLVVLFTSYTLVNTIVSSLATSANP